MTVHSDPMKTSSPTLHATIGFTLLVFVAMVVMSFVFQVEIVARGTGRVIPVSRVQVIQPEFSGRVTSILVGNGDIVESGDVLIEFDPTEAISDLGIIQDEQNRLRIEKARIEALVAELATRPVWSELTLDKIGLFAAPTDLANNPYVAEQQRLFRAEIADFSSSLKQFEAREVANRRSEEVTQASIARVDAALGIQLERLTIAEQLLEQGTASRAAFLDVQQAAMDLERERDVFQRELALKMADREALERERLHLIASLRSARLDRNAQIDARLAILAQQARVAQRRVDAAVLRAPVSGTIDQLSVFTIGGVAASGSELLRIVPSDVELELEAVFSNQGIGFMALGQKANIRLDAYPAERFGAVSGRVSDISADSTQGPQGQWGFIVRVEPEDRFLSVGSDSFALRPGMTAAIDVTTGKRRLVTYFFAPIVRTILDALGER